MAPPRATSSALEGVVVLDVANGMTLACDSRCRNWRTLRLTRTKQGDLAAP
jgi:hypothetical protein